jgi:prefoldin subunit 5
MEIKQRAEKVVSIIKEHKTSPNKDLLYALDFLKEDFEKTKENIINLTKHLDKVENSYNLILKEYQNRTTQK